MKSRPIPRNRGLDLARVLVVDNDLTSRLTLQTVLEAGGYHVDSAASAAEAVDKLSEQEYELVLSDVRMESPDSGFEVLAHARMMDYEPATALITKYQEPGQGESGSGISGKLLIEPEDLPELLSRVAELVGERASRRLHQDLHETTSS